MARPVRSGGWTRGTVAGGAIEWICCKAGFLDPCAVGVQRRAELVARRLGDIQGALLLNAQLLGDSLQLRSVLAGSGPDRLSLLACLREQQST